MDEKLINTINKMLPPELNVAKMLIDSLVEAKPNKRTTNLEYLETKKIVFCPIDNTHRIKKNGHEKETQRYWCYDCKKSFTITNNTILKYSKLTYHQLKTLLKCMYDYKPLNETALEIGISETASFEIEIRIFDALEKINSNHKLKGVIQVDEKYVSTSFKGFPKEKMPRISRHNGEDNKISGISNDQVCIIVAIDEYDELLINVAGNGPASSLMIEKALNNKIEKDSILVTDSKNSYINFCNKNNLKLVQIPAGLHKVENYTINDVNEIMTEISNYIFEKRGISSRHLQHHMNFIRYRKIIKYTIEYLEINEVMYVDTVLLVPRLKTKDVYSTELPFDIDEYKKWYSEKYGE